MFSFEVYNSWIKKQISKPLEDILTLLEKNQDTLIQKQNDIALQIKDTEKIELKSVLKLQVKRIKMQLKDINKFIPMLEDSITKLK